MHLWVFTSGCTFDTLWIPQNILPEKWHFLQTLGPLQKLSKRSQRRKQKLSFTSTSCSCQLEKGWGRERKQMSQACGFLPRTSAQCTGRLQAGLPTATPAPRAKLSLLLPACAHSGCPVKACRVFPFSPKLKREGPSQAPSHRVVKLVQVSLSWMKCWVMPSRAALCTSPTAPALH